MKKLILTSFWMLFLTSCGANKFLSSPTTPPNEISDLSYFEPLSYIQYIEKGNKVALSDSLSKITFTKLDSILSHNKSTYGLNSKIVINDHVVKSLFENELGYLSETIGLRRNLKNIPLTPTIDSILKSQNQRFALAIVATGFGRKKGNYGGQVAKGAAIGLLTLGMYVPTPIKSNLTLHAFIFDSEKNEIVFYNRSMPVEKDPTNSEFIKNQLISLFNGYFLGKN